MLTPNYLSDCGWNALLPPRPIRTLDEDLSCDLAVVGAGYTGIAAARRWAELRPDDSVLVLDTLALGEGNPGRNSGFLLPITLAEDADGDALERIQAGNVLIERTMAELEALVEGSAEPVDLQRAGTYRAAAGAAGAQALARYRNFLDAAGLTYAVLDKEDLKARIGSTFYREGLYSPDCYLVQPAALIRALAAALPENVTIFERSPIDRLVRDRLVRDRLIRNSTGWQLQSGEYRVRAGRVVLANNAFAKTLIRGAGRVVAMYTSAGFTAPLPPSTLHYLGSEPQWGLLPAHRLGCTLRRTGDGRLLVRAFHRYEAEADPASLAIGLQDVLRRRFPDLNLPELANVWSGAIGYTLGGGPLWGRLADNLWVSAGCNGGGVVKGSLFGRAVAELAAGVAAPDVAGLFGRASWLPPEPLRRWGFELTSRRETRQGAAEV